MHFVVFWYFMTLHLLIWASTKFTVETNSKITFKSTVEGICKSSDVLGRHTDK